MYGQMNSRQKKWIRNYFSNAMNHVKGDKIIDIKYTMLENKVRIGIFNTGDPIPEDSVPHLWEKFYKADKARTREYGGSGVGLSIVKWNYGFNEPAIWCDQLYQWR